jgi:hypothetical protein
MGQQRQDVGEDPPLSLEKLGEKEFALRIPLGIVRANVAGMTSGSMFALTPHGNLLKATVRYQKFSSGYERSALNGRVAMPCSACGWRLVPGNRCDGIFCDCSRKKWPIGPDFGKEFRLALRSGTEG